MEGISAVIQRVLGDVARRGCRVLEIIKAPVLADGCIDNDQGEEKVTGDSEPPPAELRETNPVAITAATEADDRRSLDRAPAMEDRQANGRLERLDARPDAPGGDVCRSRACLGEFILISRLTTSDNLSDPLSPAPRTTDRQRFTRSREYGRTATAALCLIVDTAVVLDHVGRALEDVCARRTGGLAGAQFRRPPHHVVVG